MAENWNCTKYMKATLSAITGMMITEKGKAKNANEENEIICSLFVNNNKQTTKNNNNNSAWNMTTAQQAMANSVGNMNPFDERCSVNTYTYWYNTPVVVVVVVKRTTNKQTNKQNSDFTIVREEVIHTAKHEYERRYNGVRHTQHEHDQRPYGLVEVEHPKQQQQ